MALKVCAKYVDIRHDTVYLERTGGIKGSQDQPLIRNRCSMSSIYTRKNIEYDLYNYARDAHAFANYDCNR